MSNIREYLEESLHVNGLCMGPIYNALWAQIVGVNCAVIIAYIMNRLWKTRDPEITKDGMGYILEIGRHEIYTEVGLKEEEERKAWNRMARDLLIEKLPRANVGMKMIAFYPSRLKGFVCQQHGFYTPADRNKFDQEFQEECRQCEEVFANR